MLTNQNGIKPSQEPGTGVYARGRRQRRNGMTEQMSHTRPKPKTIEITIDEQRYEVREREMTVGEILALAGKTFETHYLVEIKGKKERERYDESPDQRVKLHRGSKFVTVFRGETPVS
jgi:hypothetical protein